MARLWPRSSDTVEPGGDPEGAAADVAGEALTVAGASRQGVLAGSPDGDDDLAEGAAFADSCEGRGNVVEAECAVDVDLHVAGEA